MYKIVRHYFDEDHPDNRMVVKTGLTLEEAQDHCQDPATRVEDAHGHTVWFDGYTEES